MFKTAQNYNNVSKEYQLTNLNSNNKTSPQKSHKTLRMRDLIVNNFLKKRYPENEIDLANSNEVEK